MENKKETKTTEKFAIIKISGVQLKISEGKEYEVNKLFGKKGDKIEIKDVLLIADGEDVKIGKPNVEGATVELEITAQKKGKKVSGFTFKAKSRQRRAYGFRAEITRVKVNKINA